MSVITHHDIVYNICIHLDNKSCVSFLLTCKESPLKQTLIKNVERKGEKFQKVISIYEKRVIGYSNILYCYFHTLWRVKIHYHIWSPRHITKGVNSWKD